MRETPVRLPTHGCAFCTVFSADSPALRRVDCMGDGYEAAKPAWLAGCRRAIGSAPAGPGRAAGCAGPSDERPRRSCGGRGLPRFRGGRRGRTRLRRRRMRLRAPLSRVRATPGFRVAVCVLICLGGRLAPPFPARAGTPCRPPSARDSGTRAGAHGVRGRPPRRAARNAAGDLGRAGRTGGQSGACALLPPSLAGLCPLQRDPACGKPPAGPRVGRGPGLCPDPASPAWAGWGLGLRRTRLGRDPWGGLPRRLWHLLPAARPAAGPGGRFFPPASALGLAKPRRG